MKLNELKKELELPEWVHLDYSNFSDVSFSCFEEAGRRNKNPNEIAVEIAGKINSKYVKKVESSNGYINIDLSFEKLERDKHLFSDIGISSAENSFTNKSIRLEHTSVNPNKALHIGHMRNSYIGEFIRKSLVYSSAKVITSNFIEDTGAQVADIIVGFKHLKKPIETEEKFDVYCSKVYKEVNEEYERDNSLKNKRSEVLQEIERGNKDTLEFLENLVNKILLSQLSTLVGENIKYDLLDLERYILGEGIVKKAMDTLFKEKIAEVSTSEKNKGCFIANIDNNEINLTRSDGTFLYIAKDITYAMIKHRIIAEKIRYKSFYKNFDGSDILISSSDGTDFDLPKIDASITLTDSSQNAEQNAVKSIIERFSGEGSYIHYSYEPVAISKDTAKYIGIDTEDKFMRMSGRKGITVEFDNLIKIVKQRIADEADKSGRKIEEESIKKMASNVIRYYVLRFSPSKMVVFDISDATSLKGDSAIYINYSYSRALSIINKTEKKDLEMKELDESERMMAKELLFWENTLDNAVKNLKPNLVCDYLHKTCDVFNSFYEKSRIIGSEREANRVLITMAFKNIIEKLSYFVGIDLVERV